MPLLERCEKVRTSGGVRADHCFVVGTEYSLSLSLVNVGIEPVRFKVKQPPVDSGLKVVYRHGPVSIMIVLRVAG